MARPKRFRTTDEIRTEYVQVCAQAGEAEYRKRAAEYELNRTPLGGLYLRLYDLNLEHAAAVAAQSKETKSDG